MEKIQLEKAIIYKSVLKFNFFALCEKKILKCDENFINLKKDEPLRVNAVNLVIFTNALCHFNATPLSVAVLAPCAWGGNLACGGAWQGVLLGRNGAWQGVVNLATHNTAQRGEFDNETAKRDKIQRHSKAKSAWQVWRKWAVLAGETDKAKMEQCLLGEADKAKMGQCLGGGLLSLVARTF